MICSTTYHKYVRCGTYILHRSLSNPTGLINHVLGVYYCDQLVDSYFYSTVYTVQKILLRVYGSFHDEHAI